MNTSANLNITNTTTETQGQELGGIELHKAQVGCPISNDTEYYKSVFGVDLAVPQWEAISTAVILSMIIIFTIVGNVLVILSVFTYKPLRIVQNFFIVSLAVADLTVAVLVLPFNVAYSILGRWEFGKNMCKMWLTCDVLCCTSSILNLCAIALDRYWAITDPINYAQKRTVERVLLLIAGVWVLSLLISSPPLIGWNDWPDTFQSDTPCRLTSNKGYVMYSSLGSFFIPLLIMTIVYIEIFIATRRRLRERAHATKINAMALRNTQGKNNENNAQTTTINADQESVSSETNHNEHPNMSDTVAHQKILEKRKKREKKKIRIIGNLKLKKMGGRSKETTQLKPPLVHEESITDNNPNDNSSESLTKANGDEIVGGDCETVNGNNVAGVSTGGDCVEKNNKATDGTGCNSKINEVNKHKTKKFSIKKSSGVYQFIEEKQKISLSKERRAARTLGIIMGVFVICWLPFFLMYVITPFCETCCPTDKFINFITWLGYINSALNPIIYTIFNLEYRRAFKRLLGIKF